MAEHDTTTAMKWVSAGMAETHHGDTSGAGGSGGVLLIPAGDGEQTEAYCLQSGRMAAQACLALCSAM